MSRGDPRREEQAPARPWYRQLWPWLLMVMPLCAVVGGSITFWLAATTNNALVVDDYYREGQAINRVLARDRRAVELGLSATLSRDPDGSPRLLLSARDGVPLPKSVSLRLVHSTRADLDRSLTLYATASGVYRSASGALPSTGRWNVMIEDPQGQWRLVGLSYGFGEPLRFGAAVR